MGKNMHSLGFQGKAASFHSIIFSFYALPNTTSYSWTDYVCISNDRFQIALLHVEHSCCIKIIKILVDL